MCTVPRLSELDLNGVDTVAVDLETYDPGLKKHGSGAIRNDGFVCGIAVATDNQKFYFPINHAMTDNLEADETWAVLNEKIFQNPDIRKVFHNAMYDVCWIRSITGEMLKGKLLDTMIAASVLDETRMKYSLDSVSKDYLKDSKYKYDLQNKAKEFGIKDPMSSMHKLPYSVVKDYAEQDVELTLKLWRVFESKLDAVEFEDKSGKIKKTCRKIFDLETDLFPCLVDMKFKGVRFDVEGAKKFGKNLERRRDSYVRFIKRKSGVDVQIWAAASIKKLLDQQEIVDYEKTPKSGMPKLPKNYLTTHENPCLRAIARARECDKANNAFIEGLLGFVHNGRIHADINQIRSDDGGTVTGRFSMSNPNLQQIPARGWIGEKMRKLFLPEENCTWGSFDYSQQEPRIVVHYAIKVLNNLDSTNKNTRDSIKTLKEMYEKQKDADFHQIVADMAKIGRHQAKTINLGLFYGMGKTKLRMELNLEQDKAKDLFDKYHDKVPFVKQLSDTVMKFSNNNEKLYTLYDRFCRFPKYESANRKWNNKTKRFDTELLTKTEAMELCIKEYKERWDEKDRLSDEKIIEQVFPTQYQPAFTYKALNRLIQGSAADMTKKAMVDLYKKGILPQIQIHDELCISIKNNEEAQLVKSIMENAIPLEINNKVTYKKGNNWGNSK
tara:strand:- start:85 stop:2082 length:1998 start_codon:yes stop_codon:yes gene_type:complete